MFLLTKDTPRVVKLFMCKDRGFTEDLVDDQEKFTKLVLEDILPTALRASKKFNNMQCIKQNINLGKMDNREFTVEFCFSSDKYSHTNFVLQNPFAVWRGLYGNDNIEKNPRRVGVSIPTNSTPTLEDLEYFKEQGEISLSNTYHEVHTEYSQIIITDNN